MATRKKTKKVEDQSIISAIWDVFMGILLFIPSISVDGIRSEVPILMLLGMGGLLFTWLAIFVGGLFLIYGFAIFMLHDDWGFIATLGFLFMGE